MRKFPKFCYLLVLIETKWKNSDVLISKKVLMQSRWAGRARNRLHFCCSLFTSHVTSGLIRILISGVPNLAPKTLQILQLLQENLHNAMIITKIYFYLTHISFSPITLSCPFKSRQELLYVDRQCASRSDEIGDFEDNVFYIDQTKGY